MAVLGEIFANDQNALVPKEVLQQLLSLLVLQPSPPSDDDTTFYGGDQRVFWGFHK